MDIHEKLVRDIDAFLLRHGMHKTEFGERALGNKHTVRRLHNGMGISSHRIAKLYSFMAEFDLSHASNKRQKKANPSRVAA